MAAASFKSVLRFVRAYLSCTLEPRIGIESYFGGDLDLDYEARRGDFDGRSGDDFLTSIVVCLYWSAVAYGRATLS